MLSEAFRKKFFYTRWNSALLFCICVPYWN